MEDKIIDIKLGLKSENYPKYRELFGFIFKSVYIDKKNVPYTKIREFIKLIETSDFLEKEKKNAQRQILSLKVNAKLELVYNTLINIKKNNSTGYDFIKKSKIIANKYEFNNDEWLSENIISEKKDVIYNLKDLINKISDLYIRIKLEYPKYEKKLEGKDGAELIKFTVDYLENNKILKNKNLHFATVIVSVFLIHNEDIHLRLDVSNYNNDDLFQAARTYYRCYKKNY